MLVLFSTRSARWRWQQRIMLSWLNQISSIYLLCQFFIFWCKALAVTTPWSIKLDQNVFCGIIDDLIERWCHNHLRQQKNFNLVDFFTFDKARSPASEAVTTHSMTLIHKNCQYNDGIQQVFLRCNINHLHTTYAWNQSMPPQPDVQTNFTALGVVTLQWNNCI